MTHFDEPNETGGNGSEDTPVENMSRSALEARVRELERENAQLKRTAARDAQLFDALAVEGIPVDQREMKELHSASPSLSDLLAELEQPESPK